MDGGMAVFFNLDRRRKAVFLRGEPTGRRVSAPRFPKNPDLRWGISYPEAGDGKDQRRRFSYTWTNTR
jgi:hypothetical protein